MDSTDTSFVSFRDFFLRIPDSNDHHTKCRQIQFFSVGSGNECEFAIEVDSLKVAELHNLSMDSTVNFFLFKLDSNVCQWIAQPICSFCHWIPPAFFYR